MMIVIISDNRIIIISLLSVLALIIFNAALSHIIIHLFKLMQCWFSTSLVLLPRIRTCESFNIRNGARWLACVHRSSSVRLTVGRYSITFIVHWWLLFRLVTGIKIFRGLNFVVSRPLFNLNLFLCLSLGNIGWFPRRCECKINATIPRVILGVANFVLHAMTLCSFPASFSLVSRKLFIFSRTPRRRRRCLVRPWRPDAALGRGWAGAGQGRGRGGARGHTSTLQDSRWLQRNSRLTHLVLCLFFLRDLNIDLLVQIYGKILYLTISFIKRAKEECYMHRNWRSNVFLHK